MSAVENYIIINGDQLSQEMKVFTATKIQKQFNNSKKILKNELKEHFKPQVQNYLKTGSDEEFFKLLEDLRKNALEKQAESMNKQLVAGFSYNKINSIFSSDIKGSVSIDLKLLQEAINQWKELLKYTDNASFGDQITAYLQIPDLVEAINESRLTVDEAKEKSRNFYLGDNNYSFVVNDKFKRSVNMQAKNIKKSYANLAVLQQLANQLKSTTKDSVSISVSEKVSEFTKSFLFSTFFTIGKILGFLSEDFFANSLAFQNFVTDEIAGSLLKDKNITISGKTSGTSSSDMFKVATSDIKLELNVPEMLKKKKNGTMSINLDLGVSLKRSRSSMGQGKINLKSSAKLGNILKKIFSNQKELYIFYSALSNYRRSSQGRYVYNNKEQMESMYSFMKAAMFPWAAAGSLTKDDFAYFFVLNDKTYTVLDLLDKAGALGFTESVNLEFNPSQTQVAKTYGQLLKDNKKYLADKQIKEMIDGISYNYQLMRKIGI